MNDNDNLSSPSGDHEDFLQWMEKVWVRKGSTDSHTTEAPNPAGAALPDLEALYAEAKRRETAIAGL